MSVLDELREALHEWVYVGYEDPYARLISDELGHTLDAFEAAHPGLVDETEPCCNCGGGVDPRTVSGLYWSLSQDSICESYLTDMWWGNLRLCPACAKEATDV
ncbi:MAG: hypothetical protein WCY09_09435 [Candidatus Omnitrophota bacterium]